MSLSPAGTGGGCPSRRRDHLGLQGTKDWPRMNTDDTDFGRSGHGAINVCAQRCDMPKIDALWTDGLKFVLYTNARRSQAWKGGGVGRRRRASGGEAESWKKFLEDLRRWASW